VKLRVPFAAVAAIGVVAAVIVIVTTKDHTGPTLRKVGGAVADSLDRYTQHHHACPATLEAIGLAPPVTEVGPFRYRTWEDGRQCQFTAGVFARDGFEEYWVYPPGDWYSLR
jgi:hypothetical protein